MAILRQFMKQVGKSLILSKSNRSISLTATAHLREIIEKKEGNTLTIEARYIPEKKENVQLELKSDACILCATGIDVKHTDVLILRQFLKPDGIMLPRKITGLCDVQYKRISVMVLMAQEAGLIPKKGPRTLINWKNSTKFNTYFDENTIRHKYNN